MVNSQDVSERYLYFLVESLRPCNFPWPRMNICEASMLDATTLYCIIDNHLVKTLIEHTCNNCYITHKCTLTVIIKLHINSEKFRITMIKTTCTTRTNTILSIFGKLCKRVPSLSWCNSTCI